MKKRTKLKIGVNLQRRRCSNPHCNKQAKFKSRHMVCACCWPLLPKPWREMIGRNGEIMTPTNRQLWTDRIIRFFRLTSFPMPDIKAWPNIERLETSDLAKFEIMLMQHLHPELEDDGPPWDGIERCEWLKQQILEKFQLEAAEAVREELRGK